VDAKENVIFHSDKQEELEAQSESIEPKINHQNKLSLSQNQSLHLKSYQKEQFSILFNTIGIPINTLIHKKICHCFMQGYALLQGPVCIQTRVKILM